ncbi:30S ribosomal protein S9 [bacterium]|nr:30S ribosomal protein S9 [bacterium]|tara:strand:- start:8330 stop:8722 length:393 start_codon:yes stop_codon:yes gene_type:complete
MAEEKYIEAVGRRKTATARVRITPAKKTTYSINEKKVDEYFSTAELQKVVKDALATTGGAFKVSAKVTGGGVPAQAEAVRHGIARALVKNDQTQRKELKAAGYLKRDPRMKERKKFGLRSARRAPQWSKR